MIFFGLNILLKNVMPTMVKYKSISILEMVVLGEFQGYRKSQSTRLHTNVALIYNLEGASTFYKTNSMTEK